MANKNFVVHNGLTVGALTIDATSGDITTTGNLTVNGSGQINVTNIGVSQIAKNDSSLSINDTGTGSTVVVAIDGATRANINSTGLNITGNVSASAGSLSSLAVSGNVSSSYATVTNRITIAGALAATVDDATALSIALGG
jgi:hypothetical protein